MKAPAASENERERGAENRRADRRPLAHGSPSPFCAARWPPFPHPVDGWSLFSREDPTEMDGEMPHRAEGARTKKNTEEWSEVHILNSDTLSLLPLSGSHNAG